MVQAVLDSFPGAELAPGTGPDWARALPVHGTTCWACGSGDFWRLREDTDWVCARCHPPEPTVKGILWHRGIRPEDLRG